MIQFAHDNPPKSTSVKAVGLISGGLDSALAVKIVKDLGVDVYGVYFSMPWGCCDKTKAIEIAQALDIKFMVMQLDERYLEIVKKPKFGYGAALNPCVDCRIHMFTRAGQYMNTIGADFVFTGEVLGQRPMSQMRNSMASIERESGLQGRLLRPLCAQLMEPTIPEQEGLIDRDKLLALNGRSRREQVSLAEKFEIKDYLPPAGGCLLTDKNFANRMKDVFTFGYRNFRETTALKWGRHFRLSPEFKITVGRDETENEALKHYAHLDDYIFEFEDKRGPTVILKGENPPEDVLATAAGFVQKFSKKSSQAPLEINYWIARNRGEICRIQAKVIDDVQAERMKI